jgi:uncharacterized protein
MTRLIIALLKLYRYVFSPQLNQGYSLYGQTCRYYPTCSAYALDAVQTYGAGRGVWLALRRLGRCHPWCAGGVDLVPAREHYRWWGRAEGTDGEDEPLAETPSTILTTSVMRHSVQPTP